MKNSSTNRPVALVTSASEGIGAAVARAFAAAGYDVCVNYRSDEMVANETVKHCETAGVRAIATQADVADLESVKSLFKTCDEKLGRVSCLVNNAGIIGGSSTLCDLQVDALLATFGTNLNGTI